MAAPRALFPRLESIPWRQVVVDAGLFAVMILTASWLFR